MLPKIEQPIYKIKVPSTGKDYSFRPFLVKEEKFLLMAKESGEESDIFTAIKQIVTNCCLDNNLNIDKLAIFDLEYIFLQIRSFSVDNIAKVAYKDNEDGKVYEFDIELNKVDVVFPENISQKVEITKNIGFIMKYPSASLYDDKDFLSLKKDHYFELILKCIDKIYENEEIYESKDIPKEELREFVENLSINVFKRVNDFLTKIPSLRYVIEYENEMGTPREIVLSSLNDFFSWR